MKRTGTALFILILTVLLFSCDGYTVKKLDTSDTDLQQDGLYEQSPSYFAYDEAKDVHSFTVGPLSKKTGYTYWMDSGENTSSDFEGLRYKVKKETGDENASFGIIFFREEKNEKQSFELCLINTKGGYVAGRITDGNFAYITEKGESSALYKGLNKDNIIEVSFDKVKKEYAVSFNGVHAYSCSYDKEDFTGLYYGIAVVVPADDLHSESVVFERLSK